MSKKLTFQEIILTFYSRFWNDQGCMLSCKFMIMRRCGNHLSLYLPLRAGWSLFLNAAYVERLVAQQMLMGKIQLSLPAPPISGVMKPSPSNIQELYLQSLELLGIKSAEHDIRFVEDNPGKSVNWPGWSGWEVWLDGAITRLLTPAGRGGLPTQPVTAEVTYGLASGFLYPLTLSMTLRADGNIFMKFSLSLSMSIPRQLCQDSHTEV